MTELGDTFHVHAGVIPATLIHIEATVFALFIIASNHATSSNDDGCIVDLGYRCGISDLTHSACGVSFA
jgi:hypothetical protein